MPTSLSSASSTTGQIYLEERNVAGGEEEKEWVFAPESDNVVILVPYQVKTQSAKRATNVLPKSNESVRRIGEPSFLSFNVRACGIRRPLHHHLFPGWNLGQLQALVFKLWDLLWVRKEGESRVELVFSVSEWQKCSRQFACHPEPFARFLYARTRLFIVELLHPTRNEQTCRWELVFCCTRKRQSFQQSDDH